MLSAINHSLGNFQYPPLQQDAVEPQRRKRSLDETQSNTPASDQTPRNKRRSTGSVAGLGGGYLL